MLTIQSFVFNDFQENTYIIWDESLQCAIIDPGCYLASEQTAIKTFITQKGLKPSLLLNTHCHIDHILGNAFIANTYELSLNLHEAELKTYQEAGKWAAMFNLPAIEIPENKVFIKEGDVLSIGNHQLKVLFTPGHSIASLSFYNEESKLVIAGDVLFKGSIGRTDLPNGNFDTLAASIRTQLYTLPDETIVYPGHGAETTIGTEKAYNQYVKFYENKAIN